MNKRNIVASLPRGRDVLTPVGHYRRTATHRRRIQGTASTKRAQALLRRLTKEGWI